MLGLLSIVTIPDATTVLSSSTAYASTLFSDFLGLIWLAVGVVVAAAGALYVRRMISKGATRVLGGKRGRGRRR